MIADGQNKRLGMRIVHFVMLLDVLVWLMVQRKFSV